MLMRDLLSASALLVVLLWYPVVAHARYELRKTKLKNRQGKPRYSKSSKSAILANAAAFNADVRNLQDEEPCISLSTTVQYSHNGLTWQDPSFFTACASSLEIDTENMQLHIESLRELFQQYQ
jgi:hypothetical protein